MREMTTKLLVKVLNENHDKLSWEHFCYVPRDLYLKFLSAMEIERVEVADYISKWAKQDFNIDLSMTTTTDIKTLKELILDKYRSVYPHIFISTDTDHQGWVRVWITAHMNKDLEKRRR